MSVNTLIPRQQVHTWSEDIGNQVTHHEASLTRLLKAQRRLTRFLEENQGVMTPQSAGVGLYLLGVVIRMFDLAGGRLRSATWEQIRAASGRVQGVAGDLLPPDKDFPQRVRNVDWRAQPHILDEALMALFEREKKDEEEDLNKDEAMQIFFLLWVATEVLDANWKPQSSFAGEKSYVFTPIEEEN